MPDDRRVVQASRNRLEKLVVIVLMGNPNVGKSAVFARLTGANVVSSNYPGTTVEFTEGRLRVDGAAATVIDVPGTYSLEPTSPAERAAVEMVGKADVVVDVVEATNLERSLNLTISLLRTGRPMLVALNMWDEALAQGIRIDLELLERKLGVPVVATCALSGEGIKRLTERLSEARPGQLDFDESWRWSVIGGIVDAVQQVAHHHPTFGQKLGRATVHPFWGMMLAAVVLTACFELVRLVGEGLSGRVMEPAFDALWRPVVARLSAWLGGGGLLHDVLVGRIIDGRIDFTESFGLLTTGLFIPLGVVLPYVFSFYLVLGLLEDIGYLPRLGVLMDRIMHRLGLHGLAVVPVMLGLGCNVPGLLAARVLETRKERFIASTLLSICVPCMAQLAMVTGLLGKYGAAAFVPFIGTLLVMWIVLGAVLKRFTGGETPEILVDIPPYRMPYWRSLLKKLWMRLRWFVTEAVPFVLLGVLGINLLHSLGAVQWLAWVTGPVMTRLLNLPPEAVGALVVGFFRKDVAVGMLAPLGLSLRQLIVASVVLTAYFPCAASFVVLLRELGLKDMLKSACIMVTVAFSVGALLTRLLAALGM